MRRRLPDITFSRRGTMSNAAKAAHSSDDSDTLSGDAPKPGMLAGIRVVEVSDELAESCGLVLAGLGADVVKVEPPEGNPTRRIGPFYEDVPGPERSIFFWAYNRGKRSVVADLDDATGRETVLKLIAGADVVLDATSGRLATALASDTPLMKRFPHLVWARASPFGEWGPWKDYKASDLIHLALGGVMMNCGYDADPSGRYDIAPIAPQVWHAYNIAGEQLAIAIVAALLHRNRTGEGQEVTCAIHEAVSKNTEVDLMSWVMRRAPIYRQTCRHAAEKPSRVPNISHTKDGRWVMSWGVSSRDKAKLVPFLDRYGMAADLTPPPPEADLAARNVPGSAATDEQTIHTLDVIQRFVRAHTYESVPWREAQEAGLLWAPVRKPHENALDPHWRRRGTFSEIEHPELGRSFVYPTSRWLSTATAWQTGKRAPQLGEHNCEVMEALAEASTDERPASVLYARRTTSAPAKLSRRGRPFALQNIRILDFSWFLASAGGTRFLAALGAESIKVEWKQNPDTRLAAMAPVGGRAAREAARAPLPGVSDPDMGGQFNNKNAGKRGLSLNIRHPEGLDIARRLVAVSDIVAEGFSPGVLQRLGLGYDVIREIRPDIIYIQQSGMGSIGSYGRFRTVGPVAASFAGTSDMSGLPEPAMPAGWGYSYLDWMGAYGFALATLGALHHRDRTGEGQWIDSSQCEAGIFQTAPAVLDWSANGRPWTRYGNRSPYKPAAPHGAYRARGDDNWIAIACFDESEWGGFLRVSGLGGLGNDPRFASLASRLENQDALDSAVEQWTGDKDAYEMMAALQDAGVPAGVCQTAADRCDRDPQLAALEWMTEVTGTKLGRWPVIELPSKLSATPAHSGGPIDRGAPCYGEDNEAVLGELLGYTASDIRRLAEEGVI
ncbi:CaiB/BaiF CoA transferase family protein [Marinivivus vitaminiproducens]|uniref:CaiB/BaiF CoA transferase family protein n=1 Tax=Marinivivus vitaminiproducens TaxID=3035935 RepID=UPI0027A74F70|nr:CoA transferase [Geminicoccaceae bacterium SCSIO 64248]